MSEVPPPPPPPSFPPPAPVPFPQPELSAGQKTGRYFIGIGLGFVPVLVALALALISGSLGGGVATVLSNVTVFLPCLLGLGFLGLMIYFLTQPRFRFIGYGMLTVLVALPVIAVAGCILILSNSSF